jgi:hypothetical protein
MKVFSSTAARLAFLFVGLLALGLIIYGCAADKVNRAREQSGHGYAVQSAPSASVKNTLPYDQYDSGMLPTDGDSEEDQFAARVENRGSDSGIIAGAENPVGGWLPQPSAPPAAAEAPAKKPAMSPQALGVGGAPSYRGTVRPADVRQQVAAQSLPSANEELWVIQKPATAAARDEHGEPLPGSGMLVTKLPGEQKTVPVPLKHTEVTANITGYIASVDVKQQFHNPYESKIEAVYVFPLPTNAAVNEFVMTIGDRKIRGIIREREEARRIYDEAKSGGYVASLLTQERPNVFTQSVANIEPGKAIDIDIRYFNTLGYSDGWYEFVFPMVVGPRFNPPGSTDGIGSTEHGQVGKSGQKTEVQYLPPDKRSGHDIGLTVDLDAGVALEKIDSRNHSIKIKRNGRQRATIALTVATRSPTKISSSATRWPVIKQSRACSRRRMTRALAFSR